MEPLELDSPEAEPESKESPAASLGQATSALQVASEPQEPLEPTEPQEPPLMEPQELDCLEAEPESPEPMEPPAAHLTPVETCLDQGVEPREAEAITSETTD